MATTTGKPIDAAYLKTQLKNFDNIILKNKYQKILQYTTMPSAAAANKGAIVQYIGESTSDYTNGYFYKCVEEAGPTYKWTAVTTQAEAQEYTIKKENTADTGMSATYQLYKGSTAVGDKINVPKDWLLNGVTLNTCTEADKPETGYVIGDKYFDFEFNVKETAQETSTHIYLKVNDLVDTYTGGDGIDVDSSNVISVKLASTSGLEVVSTEGADKGKITVKADSDGPINVSVAGVNVNIATGLKVDTDKKLAIDFESTNIDFENDWN